MVFSRNVLSVVLASLIMLFSTALVLAETVPSADSVPISYRTRGEGEPALVFVHGWACNQSYWDAQVEYFAKQHKVVTLDLAGHGEWGSEREQWTIEAFGADVVAVVTHLNLQQVVLIGHSLGGPVVVEAARHLPDRVVGVVGIDTLQNVELKATPEQIVQILTPLRENSSEFIRKIVPSMFPLGSDPEVIERIVADMSSVPQDVVVNTMKASLEFDLAQASQELHVPVRCINSDKFPTDLDANRRHLESFKVVLVPESGHFFFLEHPQAFNSGYLEKVLEELAGLAASEGSAQ